MPGRVSDVAFVGAANPAPAGSAIITGTIVAEAVAGNRACRRQANSRLGETSLRRATSATVAPGSRLSARIRIFSSRDHRRRRSIPSKTSTRIRTDLKASLKVECRALRYRCRKAAVTGCSL